MNNERVSKLPSAEEARAESNLTILTRQENIKDNAFTFLNTQVLKAREEASAIGRFEAEVIMQPHYYGVDQRLYCDTITNELRRLNYEVTVSDYNNGSVNAKKLHFSWFNKN